MNETFLPRILIAGTASGSGKTTLTCALMKLFLRRGLRIAACKCGPDYIDPMFHSSVIGAPSTNLDPYFVPGNFLRFLMSRNANHADLTIAEGVMGYYDGTGKDGTDNSTYTVARETASPVILCVNAKGASASLMATIKGFSEFKTDSGIVGVVFNNVSPMTYEMLKRLTTETFGGKIKPLGYIPKLPEDCLFESRHLGLVTADEVGDLREKLEKLADMTSETLDLDGILSLAKNAPPMCFENITLPKLAPVKIAVAKDKAFCFYYRDNLSVLTDMGAEIITFSPLANDPLPDCDGLYLGGGYPELYTEFLENAVKSRESIRTAVLAGLPTIAECGGFMFLGNTLNGNNMCGVLPHDSENKGKLVRFGYVAMTAEKDGLLGRTGTTFRGHEFHYFDSTYNGADFTAVKTNGRSYSCAVYTESLYAGYPHIYFYSNLDAAVNFYRQCLCYKEKNKHDHT